MQSYKLWEGARGAQLHEGAPNLMDTSLKVFKKEYSEYKVTPDAEVLLQKWRAAGFPEVKKVK